MQSLSTKIPSSTFAVCKNLTCHQLRRTSGISSLPQSKFFPVMKDKMLADGIFKGKTAFITGGGTGLGKSMAEMLSSLGASVAIGSRREGVLQKTAEEISSKTGYSVLPIQMDVRDPASIANAFNLTEKEFGLPTLIVNNAAGNFISPTERLSPNAWKTVIDIVLNGTAYVTLEAGKRLIKAETGGTFVAITTPYARNGSGFVSPSASAKSGVDTLTKSLSAEWGRYGIRLNTISPGPVETEGAWKRLDPTNTFKGQALERVPVGRFGQPEEIANLAAFLLSDYSSWLSGENIALDGGEYVFLCGAFNVMNQIQPQQWDFMEEKIRTYNKKSKKTE